MPATLPQAHVRIRDLSSRAQHARRATPRLHRGIREMITLVNTATAALRLAIPVHAPDKASAWDAAQHALRTDPARLRRGFVSFHPDQASLSWIRAVATPVLAAGVDRHVSRPAYPHLGCCRRQ